MAGKFQEDIELAQKLCRELKAGNGKAVLELYSKHHNLFLQFTLRRLYQPSMSRAEKVLSKFWLDLLNGKAVCAYRGKASLRTYLLVILNRRILDENAKTQKQRDRFEAGEDPDSIPDSQPDAAEAVIQDQRKKILNLALSALEKASLRDANLVRMRLEGLSYEQMAERELAGTRPGRREIKKKTNAVKKQFTRPGTGSMAKFKAVLDRIMEKHGLAPDDLIK